MQLETNADKSSSIHFDHEKETQLSSIISEIMHSEYLSDNAQMYMDDDILVQSKWKD